MSSKKGPAAPVAFLKLPGTVIGPEDDIPHPPEVKNLDYEVELAIVIGKPCVDVTAEEALNYVAGYAAFNDISARDIIRGENKSGIHLMGKSFPGFAPIGEKLSGLGNIGLGDPVGSLGVLADYVGARIRPDKITMASSELSPTPTPSPIRSSACVRSPRSCFASTAARSSTRAFTTAACPTRSPTSSPRSRCSPG